MAAAACSLHQSRATNPTIAMRGSSDPSLRPSDQQPSARGAAAQASGGNSQAGMLCRAAGGSSQQQLLLLQRKLQKATASTPNCFLTAEINHALVMAMPCGHCTAGAGCWPPPQQVRGGIARRHVTQEQLPWKRHNSDKNLMADGATSTLDGPLPAPTRAP